MRIQLSCLDFKLGFRMLSRYPVLTARHPREEW